MKKNIALLLVALGFTLINSEVNAQLTATTMKLIRGASVISHTGAVGAVSTTYTWPQAPAATRPLQSTSGGILTFAPLTLSDNTNQITGVLGIINGGTNSAVALNNNRVMISSGNAIVENSAGTANQLLHGDLSWGAINLASAQVTGVLPVANGGTGQSSFTANSILLGNGTSGFQNVTLGNNQLLVGNAGAPTARNIQGSGGINVAIDASNITISSTLTGSSSAVGNSPYTSGGGQTVLVTPGVPVDVNSRILVSVTDVTGGNLIAAGVTARTATTFTVTVSTDLNCVVSWYISNP
ncbi:MAG: hypothetical protein Q8916_02030 [Bacteroidota bacterium]|nr:hypothetical protein [Bacteroidota bacterium]MDP4229166.1 hypothetical protein [Bacteroidota bacterium]